MQETEKRFFIFINKLQTTLEEFAQASIEELIEINDADTDEFKREYLKVKAAVLGQVKSLQNKADQVLDQNIINASFPGSESFEMRNNCANRKNEFDDLCYQYSQKIEQTHHVDYEIKYQKIIDEYQAIKNNFHCSQCSSPIFIDKLYFTTTYITCPACNTKNTFEPSIQAKQLEDLARNLAEQRTEHLLKQYQESSDKSPVLYQKYLRAMFDQWNEINPSMQREHEKFYNTLINQQK